MDWVEEEVTRGAQSLYPVRSTVGEQLGSLILGAPLLVVQR